MKHVVNIWHGKVTFDSGFLFLSNEEIQICIQPEMVEKIKKILKEENCEVIRD